MRWVATLLGMVIPAFLAACGALLDVAGVSYVGGGDGGVDASPPDGAGTDSGAEAAAFTYHALDDPGSWDVIHVDRDLAFSGGNWQGAVFDGRFVTFAPQDTRTAVLRYDTLGAFHTLASWTQEHLDPPSGGVLTMAGAVIVRDRVFVVSSVAGPDNDALFFRGTAQDAGGWATALLPLDDPSHAFSISDGRFVYLTPLGGRSAPSGTVIRVDPNDLPSTVSARRFDAKALLSPHAAGFGGSAFDGRYLYFLPVMPTTGSPATFVTRFDTASPDGFESLLAWSFVDLASLVPASPGGFQSSTFDGRYLYLFGWRPQGVTASNARIVRFDTRADFASAASWSMVDLAPGDAGAGLDLSFYGATFDGRNVYAIASSLTTLPMPREIVRYDTTHPFAAGSFESVPFPGIIGGGDDASQPPTLSGAAFDGEFVYFADLYGNTVVRFHARDPAAALAIDGGSFY